MHIYIYMHPNIYIYIHTHVCIYIYTYTHMHAYTYMYIYMHAYIYTHLNIHIYIYIYIYTDTCICVCIYIHIYILTHTHTHTCIYICKYIMKSQRRFKTQSCLSSLNPINWSVSWHCHLLSVNSNKFNIIKWMVSSIKISTGLINIGWKKEFKNLLRDFLSWKSTNFKQFKKMNYLIMQFLFIKEVLNLRDLTASVNRNSPITLFKW